MTPLTVALAVVVVAVPIAAAVLLLRVGVNAQRAQDAADVARLTAPLPPAGPGRHRVGIAHGSTGQTDRWPLNRTQATR